MFDPTFDVSWLIGQVILFGICGTIPVPVFGVKFSYSMASAALLTKLLFLFGAEIFV